MNKASINPPNKAHKEIKKHFVNKPNEALAKFINTFI